MFLGDWLFALSGSRMRRFTDEIVSGVICKGRGRVRQYRFAPFAVADHHRQRQRLTVNCLLIWG
jgi:hypothetical protein